MISTRISLFSSNRILKATNLTPSIIWACPEFIQENHYRLQVAEHPNIYLHPFWWTWWDFPDLTSHLRQLCLCDCEDWWLPEPWVITDQKFLILEVTSHQISFLLFPKLWVRLPDYFYVVVWLDNECLKIKMASILAREIHNVLLCMHEFMLRMHFTPIYHNTKTTGN